jgi:hypothetical protein
MTSSIFAVINSLLIKVFLFESILIKIVVFRRITFEKNSEFSYLAGQNKSQSFFFHNLSNLNFQIWCLPLGHILSMTHSRGVYFPASAELKL